MKSFQKWLNENTSELSNNQIMDVFKKTFNTEPFFGRESIQFSKFDNGYSFMVMIRSTAWIAFPEIIEITITPPTNSSEIEKEEFSKNNIKGAIEFIQSYKSISKDHNLSNDSIDSSDSGEFGLGGDWWK